MEKKFGKNKAGYHSSKKTVTLIISILAVSLFIGAAVQPVIASPISKSNSVSAEIQEECIPCKVVETTKKDPPCTTCACAVNYAVAYMIDFVNDTMKDHKFPLWRAELVGMIFEGLVVGFIESGFKFNVDAKVLKVHIKYWIDELVEPDNYRYNVTEILANIYAIGIGITGYLLTLCENNIAKSLTISTCKTPFFLKIISLFYKWIKIIY